MCAWSSRAHILVTGGAGFLGGRIAAALESTGHRVTRLDRVAAPGVILGDVARLAELLPEDTVLDAVIHAAEARFRPILMTSLATMLGAVPIALALGAGAESRTSLGIVIIFGLLFSLVLTLFVIPAMYTFLTSKKDRKLVSEEDYDEQK